MGVPPFHLDTSTLYAFDVLVRERVFARAARVLHVDPSTLTRQIKRLESEVGATLVQRTRAGVVLTEAGAAFHGHVREALSALESARRALSRRGSLRLGAVETVADFVLPPAIAELARTSEAALELRVGYSGVLEGMVQDGQLDAAIVSAPSFAPDLVCRTLWSERYLVALPRAHPLRGAVEGVRLTALRSERWVVGPSCRATSLLERTLAARALPYDVACETSDSRSALRLVAAGVGVGFVPSSVARLAPDLAYVPVLDAALSRRVVLVHPGRETLDPQRTLALDRLVSLACRQVEHAARDAS